MRKHLGYVHTQKSHAWKKKMSKTVPFRPTNPYIFSSNQQSKQNVTKMINLHNLAKKTKNKSYLCSRCFENNKINLIMCIDFLKRPKY